MEDHCSFCWMSSWAFPTRPKKKEDILSISSKKKEKVLLLLLLLLIMILYYYLNNYYYYYYKSSFCNLDNYRELAAFSSFSARSDSLLDLLGRYWFPTFFPLSIFYSFHFLACIPGETLTFIFSYSFFFFENFCQFQLCRLQCNCISAIF